MKGLMENFIFWAMRFDCVLIPNHCNVQKKTLFELLIKLKNLQLFIQILDQVYLI